MTYVMSDLHGQYEKYREILKKINFGDSDTLYILGDLVDRGNGGIKILSDVMCRPNVICLIGNHDWTFASLMQNQEKLFQKIGREKTAALFGLWFSDGGAPTYSAFAALQEKQKKNILRFIDDMRFILEISIHHVSYFLAHTVPAYNPEKPLMASPAEDFLHGEPDYEIPYFEDQIVVTGHTPTELIDPACKGRIWMGNRHIALDCGAGFGGPLGCLCLENRKEFYV